jgi:CheY-like chemotaxis protein
MGRRILMDAGYEVITVNNGSAALKKIHESRPDLIVLDVYMPGYGGLEVCQRLKESRETARIPILLTVGKMEPFKSDEAKRVHADGHIVKPFDAGELLAALTKLEDRIVPQPETGRGRKSKKARSWHAGDDPAQAPDEWTEKIAYLASAKERLVSQTPEGTEQHADTAEAAIKPARQVTETFIAPIEPAPELPVVASSEPAEEATQQSSVPDEAAAELSLTGPPLVEPSSPAPEVEPAAEIPAAAASTELDSSTPVQAEEAKPADESQAVAAPDLPAERVIAQSEQPEQLPTTADSDKPARKPRWIAETVAVSAEEATLELEAEMQLAQAQSGSTSIPAAENVRAVSESSVPESDQPNGATFAAAASASSFSATVSAVSSAQERVTEEEEPAAGLDAAAAWQNWQQIRDSVMSPQGAAALAESLAQTAKATAETSAASSDLTATGEVSAVPASDSVSVDGEALASIVDSVLAELKPKLMQEIAKKLKK